MVVHDVSCFNIGELVLSQGCEVFNCKTLMAAKFLRTLIIVPLKEGFRKLGLHSRWEKTLGVGNPADSLEVQQYFNKVKLQRLSAEVAQKKPAVLLHKHVRALLHGMRALSFAKRYTKDMKM